MNAYFGKKQSEFLWHHGSLSQSLCGSIPHQRCNAQQPMSQITCKQSVKQSIASASCSNCTYDGRFNKSSDQSHSQDSGILLQWAAHLKAFLPSFFQRHSNNHAARQSKLLSSDVPIRCAWHFSSKVNVWAIIMFARRTSLAHSRFQSCVKVWFGTSPTLNMFTQLIHPESHRLVWWPWHISPSRPSKRSFPPLIFSCCSSRKLHLCFASFGISMLQGMDKVSPSSWPWALLQMHTFLCVFQSPRWHSRLQREHSRHPTQSFKNSVVHLLQQLHHSWSSNFITLAPVLLALTASNFLICEFSKALLFLDDEELWAWIWNFWAGWMHKEDKKAGDLSNSWRWRGSSTKGAWWTMTAGGKPSQTGSSSGACSRHCLLEELMACSGACRCSDSCSGHVLRKAKQEKVMQFRRSMPTSLN